MDERPRRSLLYVPASSEPMLRKAGSRGADVLIVDLEDGVLPAARDAAREQAQRVWGDLDFGGAEPWLRVNAAGTHWHLADLEAARRIRPAAVVLPKCEEAGVVEAVTRRLPDVPLLLMVETAAGIRAAAGLARVPGVAGLLLGAADFRASIHAGRDPEEGELLLARGALVLAARAAEIQVFDTPYFDYKDTAGLERSARRARTLGFDGKAAIHPSQLPPIRAAFLPTPAELERARRVLQALQEAARDGRGVATVDGEMVEALHAAEARRTLARAEASGG
ncbi:MAG: HpcH/HpaI aldolase/citrate lyase family protein [Betaproteobacteria bacterium]